MRGEIAGADLSLVPFPPRVRVRKTDDPARGACYAPHEGEGWGDARASPASPCALLLILPPAARARAVLRRAPRPHAKNPRRASIFVRCAAGAGRRSAGARPRARARTVARPRGTKKRRVRTLSPGRDSNPKPAVWQLRLHASCLYQLACECCSPRGAPRAGMGWGGGGDGQGEAGGRHIAGAPRAAGEGRPPRGRRIRPLLALHARHRPSRGRGAPGARGGGAAPRASRGEGWSAPAVNTLPSAPPRRRGTWSRPRTTATTTTPRGRHPMGARRYAARAHVGVRGTRRRAPWGTAPDRPDAALARAREIRSARSCSLKPRAMPCAAARSGQHPHPASVGQLPPAFPPLARPPTGAHPSFLADVTPP